MQRSIFAIVLAILALGGVSSARAMTFRLTSCPRAVRATQCVAAEGPIEMVTAPNFRVFAESGLRPGAMIFIDSPGGNLLASLGVGDMIRRGGYHTEVSRIDVAERRLEPGSCASGCVYLFIGGVRRYVPEGSRLGVHQVRLVTTPSEGQSQVQMLMSQTGEYLRRMGVRIDVLFLALRTSPEGMYWFSRDELVRLRLTSDQAVSVEE